MSSKKETTLYLENGTSKIDGILVYNNTKGVNEVNTFLRNLKETGLVLESVPLESKPELTFVKIHAPNDVLLKYSDVYSVTFRKDESIVFPLPEVPFAFLENVLNSPRPNPNDPVCKRAWQTISKQRPTVITSCERSCVVFLIMDYIQFGDDNFDVGLRQLLQKGIILDAYPLHDGRWKWPTDQNEPLNDRQLLAEYWASYSMFFKQQPLDTIQNYYGYEIATYFAWLGFYNKMLVYAVILGIISFCGGLILMNIYTLDHLRGFCNHTGVLCNKMLVEAYDIDNLEKISSTCSQVYVTYTNSNLVTLVYSTLIVLWCTIFKETWKRELNVLNAQWGNPVFEYFVLRPQFIANATKTRLHMYTGEPELYISFVEQLLRYMISGLGTALMILTVIGSLIAVVYLEYFLTNLHYSRIQIIMLTTFLSLAFMIVLEIIFNNNLLTLLTTIEMPRTDLDYEKSIIVKSLLFLFINSYGRLIYIAFFKGKLAYYYSVFSNDYYTKDRLYPFPSEYCMPPSCVFEVICLLGAVLILKPIILNIIQLTSIYFTTRFRQIMLSLRNLEKRPRWECDFAKNTIDSRYILNELNKLIIQFGFVSFFAACCPLAPLVALIYNLISIRADATKIVKFYKRPIERKQVTSIGICFDVFETMAYVAIVINALFMAYTCKFIHMYLYYTNRTETMDPVIVNEYSEMTYDYESASGSTSNTCFCQGMYNKPEDFNFQLMAEHYDFLSYKANLALAFLLTGFLISAILSYIIPDMPRSLLEFIHYHEEKIRNKDL